MYSEAANGVYTVDPTKSNSYKVVDQGGFNESFFDGSGISGDWFRDNFKLEDSEVINFVMGIAKNANHSTWEIVRLGQNSSQISDSNG